MSDDVPDRYADVWGRDRARQNDAYRALMTESERPVPWAAAVWDDLAGHLKDADNHNRAIAAQLLCNLAAHDAGGRVFGADLDALITVTRDEKFVTARHSLKSLWRIGLAGEESRRALLPVITRRYHDSFGEKNGTLVRTDLVETLRQLYDAAPDPAVEATARELIAAEPEEKYRKKSARFWK